LQIVTGEIPRSPAGAKHSYLVCKLVNALALPIRPGGVSQPVDRHNSPIVDLIEEILIGIQLVNQFGNLIAGIIQALIEVMPAGEGMLASPESNPRSQKHEAQGDHEDQPLGLHARFLSFRAS
jgi:hypothetical protein